MLVLEKPDSEEDLMRKHLSGRGGVLLTKLLGQAGIKPQDCFITHLVKCNGTVTDEIVDTCKPWIWQEITTLKPRGIIAFGDTVSKKLLMMKSREHYGPYVGNLYPAFYKGMPDLQIMPMWGPMYLFRQGQKVHDDVVGYFKKMKTFVSGRSPQEI